MVAEPEGGYRVSCPLDILQKVRAWAEQAAARGVGQEFTSDLRLMQGKLATEPTVWGEPRYTLPSGQGRVYQGAVRLLHAIYSVHQADRVVFVIDIGLMPNPPLTDAP